MNERGIEVYSNQFAIWADGHFVANQNLSPGHFGYASGTYKDEFRAGIITNYYIAEAMDSTKGKKGP